MRASLMSRTGLRSVGKLVDECGPIGPCGFVHVEFRDDPLPGVLLQHIKDDRTFVPESWQRVGEYIAGVVALQPVGVVPKAAAHEHRRIVFSSARPFASLPWTSVRAGSSVPSAREAP